MGICETYDLDYMNILCEHGIPTYDSSIEAWTLIQQVYKTYEGVDVRKKKERKIY